VHPVLNLQVFKPLPDSIAKYLKYTVMRQEETLLSASKQLSAALEACDLAPLELLFANDITIHAGKRTEI
jgi:hypothetical protein